MRGRIPSSQLRVVMARTLALAGAATVLGFCSLLLLVGSAKPAAAACGDGVTYQAGMAADSCPADRDTGDAVKAEAGVAAAAIAAAAARIRMGSAESEGDMAALERTLKFGNSRPTAYTGVANLEDLEAQQEAAEELEELGDLDKELLEDSVHAVPEATESVVKVTVEYLKPEEPEVEAAASTPSPGQLEFQSFLPEPQSATNPETDLINPIRDAAVIIAAGHVAVRTLKRKHVGTRLLRFLKRKFLGK